MKILVSAIFIITLTINLFGQQSLPLVANMDKEEIMALSYDELLAMPFEDIVFLAEKLGVSVEDLLNMKITVSSKSALTPRESPGIVSVVTNEEIRNSGARDLIDILNLVPGFNFGYDIDGVIGIASRGNWSHEGKVLILLDGLEMNENFFSTWQFGNRIAPDQIKRLEIIRGPGSCIYGGYAELGVINIITKNGNDLKGASVSSSHGFMGNNAMRNEISVQKGNKISDFEYSIAASASNASKSNSKYTTFDSLEYDLTGSQGKTLGRNVNMMLGYKGLKTRFVYDQFTTPAFEYAANPINSFTGYHTEIVYDWNISKKLSISPKINFKNQTPWRMDDTSYEYNRNNSRLTAGIFSQYAPFENIIINAGGEFTGDNATDELDDPESVFENGNKKISYSNWAAFLQAYLKTPIVNINLGGRFDYHNIVGNNFAPRIGLTRVINKFHFKALFSKAFRAPAIENININPSIKAEKTTVSEIEAGYQIGKSMFVTANIFDIKISDAIVYSYDIDGNEGYNNFESTGTRGFELEYRLVLPKAYATVNYAYYQNAYNKVTDYEVPNDKSYLQAFPKHKIGINGLYRITKQLGIAPSAVINGHRYGFFITNDLISEYKKQNTNLLLNVTLNYFDILTTGLDLSIGVYNILDQNNSFIQAYGNSFPPLPGYSREFMFKIAYRLK